MTQVRSARGRPEHAELAELERERDPRRVSDATLAVVLREQHAWAPLDDVADAARVTLQTDRPVPEIVEELIARLDERLGR